MNLISAIREAVEAEARENLTEACRREIADALCTWFAGRVKADVPPVRVRQFQNRIRRLIQGIEVSLDPHGKLVLKARGSDEETLKFLRLGTDWFYGSEDVSDLILAGAFGSSLGAVTAV